MPSVVEGKFVAEAGENISAKEAVYIAGDGKMYKALADVRAHLAMGLCEDTVSLGESCWVYTQDYLGGFTSLTPGDVYYLSQETAGAITNDEPTSGLFQPLGTAQSSSILMVKVDKANAYVTASKCAASLKMEYAESDGVSGKTGTDYSQKVRLSFTATACDYLIMWSAEVNTSHSGTSVMNRVQINDETTIYETNWKPDEADINGWGPISGMKKVTMSEGSVNVDFDYASSTGHKQVSIRKAKISALKVA